MYIPELIIKEGLRRGLSIKTIKTYRQCIKQFFWKCRKEPYEINKRDIKGYLDKMIEKGVAGSTVNVHLNALRFLYNDILNKRLMINIKFSKTPKHLPEVLTKEETKKIIESIENSKHKLMIKLLYSAGLRVSELVNLKVRDFEFEKNYAWVRKGKGNKDRLFIIAENLRQGLMDFVEQNNLSSDSYLFIGQKQDPISIMTIQKIIKNATRKAHVIKNVHPHTLRHSFATHLIENGYDVASVQSLLGHNSSETTMVYLHMASPNMINVKSPFDSL